MSPSPWGFRQASRVPILSGMEHYLPLLPGLLLLVGQLLVAVAHVISSQQAADKAAELLRHPLE